MSLGLQRGIVKLVPHNPQWALLFEQEKNLLLDTFGDTIIAIEHVGSTAIPRIIAKPIIDMAVAVRSLSNVEKMKVSFEKIGYEYRGSQGMQEQELFAKGPEEKRTHYAHFTEFNSNYWKEQILFRDYLCQHPSVAKEYAELKQQLANKHADSRYMYTDLKSSFIKKILKKASVKEKNKK